MKIFFLLSALFLTYAWPSEQRADLIHSSKNPLQEPPRIILQPLGKTDPAAIKKVQADLAKYLPAVTINPAEKMPAETYYSPRKRYRADRIIRILHNRANKGEIYLGITQDDISTTKGSTYDYGVMGLAISPGKGAVVSDSRLKDKSKVNLLAIHELGHSFGLPHCKKNGCYMQDAKGRNHTANLKDFCSDCKKFLVGKGWKLR
jgi:archaemetzincin